MRELMHISHQAAWERRRKREPRRDRQKDR